MIFNSKNPLILYEDKVVEIDGIIASAEAYRLDSEMISLLKRARDKALIMKRNLQNVDKYVTSDS